MDEPKEAAREVDLWSIEGTIVRLHGVADSINRELAHIEEKVKHFSYDYPDGPNSVLAEVTEVEPAGRSSIATRLEDVYKQLLDLEHRASRIAVRISN